MLTQVKDFFQGILDVFKARTDNPLINNDGQGNPFGGTYFFIWLIYNWEIPFSLFNFDSSYKLFSKIDFIRCYFQNKGFLDTFLTPAALTFLSLIVFFLFSFLAIGLNKIYHFNVIPRLTKAVEGKSAIRTVTQYNTVMNAYLRALEEANKANESLSIKDDDLQVRLDASNKRHQDELDLLNGSVSKAQAITDTFLKAKPYIVLAASDNTVIFKGKKGNPLPFDSPAVIVSFTEHIHGTWRGIHQKFLDKLPDAFWISDRSLITDIEATEGGVYLFSKTFNLEIEKNFIYSIVLRCCVDDILKLSVNSTPVLNSENNYEAVGGDTLHTYEITELCRSGINELSFSIENYSSSVPVAGLANPYGIIFSVVLTFKDVTQLS